MVTSLCCLLHHSHLTLARLDWTGLNKKNASRKREETPFGYGSKMHTAMDGIFNFAKHLQKFKKMNEMNASILEKSTSLANAVCYLAT